MNVCGLVIEQVEGRIRYTDRDSLMYPDVSRYSGGGVSIRRLEGVQVQVTCPDGTVLQTFAGEFPRVVKTAETMYLDDQYPDWPVRTEHSISSHCIVVRGSDPQFWLQEVCNIFYRCGAGGTYLSKPSVQVTPPVRSADWRPDKPKYVHPGQYVHVPAEDPSLVDQFSEALAEMFFRKEPELAHLPGSWHFMSCAWWQGPGCGFTDHRD